MLNNGFFYCVFFMMTFFGTVFAMNVGDGHIQYEEEKLMQNPGASSPYVPKSIKSLKKRCAFLCDVSYKSFIILFIVVASAVCLYLTFKMDESCGEIKHACFDCKNGLEGASKDLKLLEEAGKVIAKFFDRCPQGQQIVWTAVENYLKACFNGTIS